MAVRSTRVNDVAGQQPVRYKPAMAEPTLQEWRVAVAIAASGSFRATAKQLDLAPSTLSHLVSGLEHKLGLRLFNRSTRSVVPTVEGEALLARVAPLIGELATVAASAGGGPVAGELRLNTSLSAATYLLAEIVPKFMQQHPGVSLDLRHEERLVDVVAEGSDAGVRLGRTVPLDMVGVPFGPLLRFLPVASPGYLAEHGTPTHPRDLQDHRCIRTRLPRGERYAWEFSRDGETLAVDGPGALTLDRQALMMQAAVAGMGIAFVLEQAAAAHLASGTLVALLREWSPADERYLLYFPGRRHVPAPLRAFIEVLRAT